MQNANDAVFEYLIDQLRQQVNNNQCEDLAHEVQSLKSQLRDASAQIKELNLALVKATGDVEAYKLIRKGGYVSAGQRYVVGEHAPGPTVNCRCAQTPVPPEQSGCRKEDTQEWPYRFYYVVTDGSSPFGTKVCKRAACGVTKSSECGHDWVLDEKGDYFICAKCGKQEAELIDCQHTNTVGLRKGFAPGFTKKCLDCGAKLK